MRGENGHSPRRQPRRGGTSPRARGKLTGVQAAFTDVRNIPACAGKTLLSSYLLHTSMEHPRVRGENTLSALLAKINVGTSPRARGKLLLTCGSSFLMAILHSVLFFCTAGGSMESP